MKWMWARKVRATNLISEHFALFRAGRTEITMYEAGKLLVELYRELTGEMPQSPGIEMLYHADETPAVEFVSPSEGLPDNIQCVVPGFNGEPDILLEGDHYESKGKERSTYNPKLLGPKR